MPNKYFLHSTVPETALESDKHLPPDIDLKLTAYKSNKKDFRNEPSHIQPYPIEKYSVNKEMTVVNRDGGEVLEEEEDEVEVAPTKHKVSDQTILNQIPASKRSRASRLLPHLRRLGLLDDGSTKIQVDLVYDLVSATKNIRTQPIEILQSAIRALDMDSLVPKRSYRRKLGLTMEGATASPTLRKDSLEEIYSTPSHPLTQGTPHRSRPSTVSPQRKREFLKKIGWS